MNPNKTPGLCSCGNVARFKNGFQCTSCVRFMRLERKYGFELVERKRNLTPCSACGFKPVHSCQLTFDHIDGNNSNDNPSNIQLLCHNCHHLKSYVCKDNLNRYAKL